MPDVVVEEEESIFAGDVGDLDGLRPCGFHCARRTTIEHDGVVLRWRPEPTDRCGAIRAAAVPATVRGDAPSAGESRFATDWTRGDRLRLVIEARRVSGDPLRPMKIDLAGEPRPVLDLTDRPSSPDGFWNDRTCLLSVSFSWDSSGALAVPPLPV